MWFLICVQVLAIYRMFWQAYSLLILTLTLQYRYNCAHFTDEETEAWAGKVSRGIYES